MNYKIALIKNNLEHYPNVKNFGPSERYPECPFSNISSEDNDVYRSVRECFKLLKLDIDNFGKPIWNPLKNISIQEISLLLSPI